jgi:hypothetical protein
VSAKFINPRRRYKKAEYSIIERKLKEICVEYHYNQAKGEKPTKNVRFFKKKFELVLCFMTIQNRFIIPVFLVFLGFKYS